MARHANAPGPQHVNAAKRVLLYLYNTRTIGITYKKSLAGQEPKFFEGAKHPLDNGSNMLQTFADSDYAMDISRRSTMGYVLMMCGGPIAW